MYRLTGQYRTHTGIQELREEIDAVLPNPTKKPRGSEI